MTGRCKRTGRAGCCCAPGPLRPRYTKEIGPRSTRQLELPAGSWGVTMGASMVTAPESDGGLTAGSTGQCERAITGALVRATTRATSESAAWDVAVRSPAVNPRHFFQIPFMAVVLFGFRSDHGYVR